MINTVYDYNNWETKIVVYSDDAPTVFQNAVNELLAEGWRLGETIHLSDSAAMVMFRRHKES